MPRSKVPELVARIEEIGKKHDTFVANFGHAGDGNIHVNFVVDRDDPDVDRTCAAMRFGNISAFGRARRDDLRRTRHRLRQGPVSGLRDRPPDARNNERDQKGLRSEWYFESRQDVRLIMSLFVGRLCVRPGDGVHFVRDAVGQGRPDKGQNAYVLRYIRSLRRCRAFLVPRQSSRSGSSRWNVSAVPTQMWSLPFSFGPSVFQLLRSSREISYFSHAFSNERIDAAGFDIEKRHRLAVRPLWAEHGVERRELPAVISQNRFLLCILPDGHQIFAVHRGQGCIPCRVASVYAFCGGYFVRSGPVKLRKSAGSGEVDHVPPKKSGCVDHYPQASTIRRTNGRSESGRSVLRPCETAFQDTE